VEEAQQALAGVALPYMDALIFPATKQKDTTRLQCSGYVPDFLTPTPNIVQLSIDVEIERMLATPEDLVRRNIQILIEKGGESAILTEFLTYPRESLFCLAQELRLYWQRALEPHWSRLTAVLDGDVLYHARRMALEGPVVMLQDLHPVIEYHDGMIEIHKPNRDYDYELNGTGLQLVPAIFSGPGVSWQLDDPEWHPMLIYGPRGLGLWGQNSNESNPSLEIALGEGRARVLQELVRPTNTGEIARRLQVSAGAVSQHLSRLNDAGLVEPFRNGKHVYYHLTDRGTQLLVLFDKTG
jgi:DNA-binding transcriptional ArsR family regulator